MKLELVRLDAHYWEKEKEKFLSLFNKSPLEAADYFYQRLLPFYFMTYRSSYPKLPNIVGRLVQELIRADLKIRGLALIAKALYSTVDIDLLPVPFSENDYSKPMEEIAVKLLPDLSSTTNVYRKLIPTLKKMASKEPEGEHYLLEFERYYRLYEILKIFKMGEIDSALAKTKDLLKVFPEDLLGQFFLVYFEYFKDKESKKFEVIQKLQSLFPLAKEKDSYLACRLEALWGEVESSSAISYFEDVKDELLRLRLYYNLATFLRDKHLVVIEKDPGVDASGKLNTKVLAAESFLIVGERQQGYELYRNVFKELMAMEDYNTLISLIEKTQLLDRIPDEDVKREFLDFLIKAYERVVSINPSNISALKGYAEALERIGEEEKAVEIYLKLGMVALKEYEYYEKAEEAFRKVLEKQPLNLEALNHLLSILLRKPDSQEEVTTLLLETLRKLREAGKEKEAEELAAKYRDLLPSDEKVKLEKERIKKLLDSQDKEKFIQEAIKNLPILRDDEELLSKLVDEILNLLTRDNYEKFYPYLLDVIFSLSKERREKALRDTFRKLVDLDLIKDIKELLKRVINSDTSYSVEFMNYLKTMFRLVMIAEVTDKEFLLEAVDFFYNFPDNLSKRVGMLSIANTLILIDPKSAEKPVELLRELYPGDLEIINLQLRLYSSLGDREKLEEFFVKVLDEISDRKDVALSLLEKAIYNYSVLKDSVIESYLNLLSAAPEDLREEKLRRLLDLLRERKRYDLIKVLGEKASELNLALPELQEILINIYSKERNIGKLLEIAEHSLLQVKLQDGWVKALGKFLELVSEKPEISQEFLNSMISVFKAILSNGQEEDMRKADRMLSEFFGKLSSASLDESLLPSLEELLEVSLEIKEKVGLSPLEDENFRTLLSLIPLSSLKIFLEKLFYLSPPEFAREVIRMPLGKVLELLDWDKLEEKKEYQEELLRALESLEPSLEDDLERKIMVKKLIDKWMGFNPERGIALLSEKFQLLEPEYSLGIISRVPDELKEKLPPALFFSILEVTKDYVSRVKLLVSLEGAFTSMDKEELFRLIPDLLRRGVTEVLSLFPQVFSSPEDRFKLVESLDGRDDLLPISLLGMWDKGLSSIARENGEYDRENLLHLARGLVASQRIAEAQAIYEMMVSDLEEKSFSGELTEEERQLLSVAKYELARLMESSSKERAMEIYADLYISAPYLADFVRERMEALQ